MNATQSYPGEAAQLTQGKMPSTQPTKSSQGKATQST